MSEKVFDYWKHNIKKNYKKISATIGDIALTTFTILLFSGKSGLGLTSTLFILVMALKPFITLYINIITKGETDDKDKELIKQDKEKAILQRENQWLKAEQRLIRENKLLKRQCEFERDYSELKAQLAARDGKVPEGLKAATTWDEANKKINELESEE